MDVFWLLVSEGWSMLGCIAGGLSWGQKISTVGMQGRGDWSHEGSQEEQRVKNTSELLASFSFNLLRTCSLLGSTTHVQGTSLP